MGRCFDHRRPEAAHRQEPAARRHHRSQGSPVFVRGGETPLRQVRSRSRRIRAVRAPPGIETAEPKARVTMAERARLLDREQVIAQLVALDRRASTALRYIDLPSNLKR